MKKYKPTKFEMQVSEFTIAYKQLSSEKHFVLCPDHAFSIIKPYFAEYQGIKEAFFALYMNKANQVIGIHKVAVGAISGCLVDMRLIAKPAIELLASSVILFHNHPSGNNKISDADKRTTQKAKEALKLFDIEVTDHIVLVEDTYVSLSDEGML